MRKTILFIILAGMSCVLLGQTVLNSEMDSREGFVERLYQYFDVRFENGFELSNTLYMKVSEDQDELERDYLRNYIRDKLRFSLFRESFYISSHVGIQYYHDEQHETRISGADEQYRLKNAFSGGIDFFGTWDGLETLLEASWFANYYDRYVFNDAAQNSDDDWVVKEEKNQLDNDGTIKARIAYKFSDYIKPFVEVNHFNDMNDIDTYDYTEYRLGNHLLSKLDNLHTVEMEVAVVKTDAFENLPAYLDFDLRLTSKYIHDWMFINRVSDKIWKNDDESSKAYGNGFWECILQHNLNFDRENRVDRFLMAIKKHFDENVTIARTGLMYYFGPFSLYGAYHYYFGNDRVNNYKTGMELSWYYPAYSARIYYGFSLIDARYVENTTVHSINIELGY